MLVNIYIADDIVKEQAITRFKRLGRTKKLIKLGKISGKYGILTVEEKLISLIGNKTKIILEMNPSQRELVKDKTVEGGQDAN